ncbi:MAG: NarK/NasA family nitrate transporter [Deltaproteobacteria bacterium]|nr:NarK/NasA family nitrate transporter [Deltaproteobacteria bacterium]
MARLPRWEPENEQFWKETGSGIAWRTCGITTFSLLFSFATWFVMSAVVVRLPAIGFKFNTMQLFWLAAIPGLGSGTLRLLYSFFIPVWGTRPVVSVTTIIKLLPMVWLGFAVQNLNTSFLSFAVIAYLCGLGGGDFSAYMPSTSIFFPKRLQGASLGIQAGIGNFGVSVVQFVTPWIIGFSIVGFGSPQVFTKADVVKDAITVSKVKETGVVKDVVVNKPELAAAIVVTKEGDVVKDVILQETDAVKALKADVQKDAAGKITSVAKTEGYALDVKKDATGSVTDVAVKKGFKKAMWVQNAAFWYVPFLIFAFILCVIFLRSITVKSRGFKGQFEILSTKDRALTHSWNCTITYIQSFGSFSGFAAAFPMMIKVIYSGFPGGPDPLKYAFLGPLIGGLIRALTGPIFDKVGGAWGMVIPGIGMILACIALIFGGYLTPTGLEQFPMFVWLMLFMFLMTGIANAASFRLYPLVFAYSPAKGAQMLGWTGAWAAFGPFLFNALIGMSITRTGSAISFFVGAAIFYCYANFINWWYYSRKGCERHDWGNKYGTWWDKAKGSWAGGN